jgi:phosphatidylserine synthase
VLPLATLAAAVLMVSRVKYPHVVNQYIRGKRPFNYLVKFVIVGLAALLEPIITGAVIAVLYVIWGPLRAAFGLLRPRKQQ